MLKQEVLGEKLMRGVSGGLILCLHTGSCACEGGEGFTSSVRPGKGPNFIEGLKRAITRIDPSLTIKK